MMARKVFFLICIWGSQMSTNSFAQNLQCDSIYTMVDEAPMFKNGYDDLSFYIANLDYGSCELPETVILTWTINHLGEMIDIKTPGLEGECSSRIIAQLAKFPRWKPARVMGMPVCFKMSLKRRTKTG